MQTTVSASGGTVTVASAIALEDVLAQTAAPTLRGEVLFYVFLDHA